MTKIKLPIVKKGINTESLWKTIIAISETGTTFTTSQIIQAPSSPTKGVDSMSRILSYLKFMGVVSEQRGKDDVQSFTVKHADKIDHIIYSLKAKRQDEALKVWLELVLEHPMFQYILEKFFERFSTRTFIDLEHFLKKEIPNKEPSYYQDGGRFIMAMLQNCGVVNVDDKYITKVQSDSLVNSSNDGLSVESQDQDDTSFEESATNTEAIITASNGFKIKDEYFISIKTPRMKFESKIENSLQLGVIETILQTIKVELNGYNE